MSGPSSEALKDFNRRYGLTRHSARMAQTPAGPVVVALHQGPGGDDLMAKVGPSQIEFGVSFKEKILDVHGLDVTQPPPGPMPKLHLDSGS